jgi:hypothetical protein
MQHAREYIYLLYAHASVYYMLFDVLPNQHSFLRRVCVCVCVHQTHLHFQFLCASFPFDFAVSIELNLAQVVGRHLTQCVLYTHHPTCPF